MAMKEQEPDQEQVSYRIRVGGRCLRLCINAAWHTMRQGLLYRARRLGNGWPNRYGPAQSESQIDHVSEAPVG